MTDTEPPQERDDFAPRSVHEEALWAAGSLFKALSDAGLGDIHPIRDYVRDVPYVKLHRIDAKQAARLEHLVRKGMDGIYSLAEELRCAVLNHGLVDFPVPLVCGLDSIVLGDISIHTAERLACILGAEPGTELAEVPDWPEANAVCDRLAAAFKAATDGAFMDMILHSYCRRCDEDPAIELGSIKADVARRFVKALHEAPRL
ncbi:hypothetical protein GCM10012285_41810 [Streptomyces kronopolitis]|uniref:Uncharacterized protein n=1 Tax=Streptomyces kronopolitis TaxID=1612435 RepID=A0ABQ2JPF0_9ACTN|nr:hypothetical protein [Streptomyces kronopolitis]GGN51571.1 hypothetical protein GCM10012285_41810 [Streptomyces kronopolitis]